MNRVVFLLAAWVCFGLELGLKPFLQLGTSQMAPSFVITLLVFVAMQASATSSLGAGLLIGLLIDLTSARTAPVTGEAITIVGPYALGCLAASYLTLTARTMVVRHNPLTFAFLAFVASMLTHIVAAALLEFRSVYDPAVSFSAASELATRLGSSVYTAAIALPMGWVLRLFSPFFKFPQSGSSRGRRMSQRG